MTIATKSPAADPEVDLSETITGEPFSIGTGFTAKSFRQNRFDGLMDPFVMLDHYTMSEPTFGAHPHAGMSAVSILFEDSEGRFNNRDSLGNDIDLMPGDLYWLKAGRGAVHDEAPRPGSRTHGLQVFVNLPARMKHDAPASLHVASDTMPVVTADGVRVRVMLGRGAGVSAEIRALVDEARAAARDCSWPERDSLLAAPSNLEAKVLAREAAEAAARGELDDDGADADDEAEGPTPTPRGGPPLPDSDEDGEEEWQDPATDGHAAAADAVKTALATYLSEWGSDPRAYDLRASLLAAFEA